jgi:uncharacterized membrane protein
VRIAGVQLEICQVILIGIFQTINFKEEINFRKETYKSHILKSHKDLDEEQLQTILENIKNYQLPKPSLNSSNFLNKS